MSNEILDMFQELNDQAEVYEDGETSVDHWFRAREIGEEDLAEYAEAVAIKILKPIVETGVANVDLVTARVSAAFQLGFEVAAKRYASCDPRTGG
jgi:hypothetical protein